jgi:hypothetical protein
MIQSNSKLSGMPLCVWTVSVLIGGLPSTSYVVASGSCVMISNGIWHLVLATMCGWMRAVTY